MSSREKRIRLEEEVKDAGAEGVKDGAKVDAEVKTIESICEDNLLEIFSYLNAEDVKSAALVCKNWNEAIGSSAKTMKKFRLTIDSSKEKDFDYSEDGTNVCSTRKHHNLKINDCNLVHPETTLSFFNISHVKSAEIQSRLGKFITLALSRMPLLDHFFVEDRYGYGYEKVEDSIGPMLTLKKLKTIKISARNISFLAFITAESLTEIDVQISRTIVTASDGEILANFMRHCKMITKMKLFPVVMTRLLEASKWSECVANKCKLTSLTLTYLFGSNLPFDDRLRQLRLKQFLIQQGPTLKSLSIEASARLPTDFFEEVFSHLKQLTSLNLEADFDEAILNHLPGLEKLTVYRIYDGIAASNIAKFNQKLTYLSMRCFGSATVKPLEEGLTFNNLKHLALYDIRSADGWMSVVRSSPNIETVEIEYKAWRSSGTDDDTIDVLLQRPTLRHLKFSGQDIEELGKYFHKISNNPGNLKSLILYRSDEYQQIEFVFPDDPTEWNAAEQKKRFDEIFLLRRGLHWA